MADFTVANLNDSGAGSLRQAILDANAVSGADTIGFQAGLAGTITLTSGDLDITDAVTITGTGASTLTINGNNTSRIFNVDDSTATEIEVAISGMTLTGGKAGTIGTPESGGAIASDENLTISDAVITGNTATRQGGGLVVSNEEASLIIRNTTISNNTAVGDGGGLYLYAGNTTIENCIITGNTTTTGTGGGIYFDADSANAGTFKIINSTITNNTATTKGGGVYIDDTLQGGVTIQGTTISGNTAGTTGGGVHLDSPDTSVTIQDSIISGNTAKGSGGGVYLLDLSVAGASLAITNTTIIDNTADSDNTGGGTGGGLSLNDTPVTLEKTLVANNKVGTSGANPDVEGTFTANNSFIENTTGATLSGSNNTTGKDPNTVSVVVAPTATPEGGSALVYTFTRAGATTDALTVNFTLGGTATSGDYTQTGATISGSTGSITFAAGAATATLSVQALTDSVAESSETLILTLTNGLYVAGTANTATGTIVEPTALGTSTRINFNGRAGFRRLGTRSADVLVGGSKNDMLLGSGGNDNINGNGGNDILFGHGDSDTISGKSGNDRIFGGVKADRLRGDTGRDEILGGNGNDTLIGGSGNDILAGGSGNDRLMGGGGADQFNFNSFTDAIDTITDFNVAQDTIKLNLLAGTQFSAGTPFEKFFRYVKLEQVGANTAVQIDADGSGVGTTFTTIATLNNVLTSAVSSINFVIA